MKPTRKPVLTTLPLAFALAHAAPEASFHHVAPADGSTVRHPEVIVTGRIDHDILPPSAIHASMDGRPLPLDRTGRFSARVRLQPGGGVVRLTAATPNPRQQTSMISAFIDGSMIYGTDGGEARALRVLEGGLMKTSGDGLPPVDQESGQFVTGDVRANENPELLAIHALFLREHNRMASALAAADPGLDDEAIYQKARRIVAAELQVITYREFLPALLGPGALRPYRGYDPMVNPGIANEFSTAAFRIGHTLVNDRIGFLDNNGKAVRAEIGLADAFFNPAPLHETGPAPLLKYLASDNAREVDTQIVTALRDFLFGPPGAGGLDLASLNIQRGRDHGLAGYNAARRAYGLPPARDFHQITRNPGLADRLRELYGSPDSLDLWVGGLAEDHVPGSSVGPTFRRIIADQFERLRDGDSHWHERSFSGSQLAALKAIRLSDVIRRNTTVTKLQDNVFFFDPANTLTGLVARSGDLPADLIVSASSEPEPASLDGSGNHPIHPMWGSTGSALLRMAPAEYADGVSEPAGAGRPGARQVSNAVAVQTAPEGNARMMSAWIYGWGQFIDHDLSITFSGNDEIRIPVPTGDPSFDPQGTGAAFIPMTRSLFDEDTGREQESIARKSIRLTIRQTSPPALRR